MRVTEPTGKTPPVRLVLFGLVMFLSLLSPVIEGARPEAVPVRPIIVVAALLAAVMVALLDNTRRWAVLTRRVGLSLIAATLSLTLLDLLARPLLTGLVYYRSEDRHVHPWESMIDARRYDSNVDETTRTYGDLAAISGNEAARDYREIRFVTDANGFRNMTPVPASADVVLLGDSFVSGVGTTQDQTWGQRLKDQYGLNVYAMGISGDGLWSEYVNLGSMFDKIHAHAGTQVVWAIYTGNDLIDAGLDTTDLSELPWNDPFRTALTSIQVFQWRSPLRILSLRLSNTQSGASEVLARPFLNQKTALFFRSTILYSGLDEHSVKASPNFPSLTNSIHAMKQLTDSHHIRVDIVILPTKDEVYHWVTDGSSPWTSDPSPAGFSQAITKAAQPEGICVHDLKPAFITESKRLYEQTGRILWWYDDTHWNAERHAFAAALVADMLAHPAVCGATGYGS